MSRYVVYDVFTDTAFGGNQLAVFPEASDIPEHPLQKIAAEFNFSEVTFVYPPADAAHTAHVRIFTPNLEIDFAGHPLIGTLVALTDLVDMGRASRIVVTTTQDPISVTVAGKAIKTMEGELLI